MKNLFRKVHKGQGGFTLVELLVVFTLLGVLAAIIIPNVSNMLGYGHTQAADTELSVIQTAMDAMMAMADNATVAAVEAASSTMADFAATGPGGSYALYPDFLRYATSQGTYTCDTTGLVTQATTGY